MNYGFDYSGGLSNVNHDTGIHYGVIPMGDVLQAWADSSESIYTPSCPYCGNEIDDFDTPEIDCPNCNKTIKEHEKYSDEPDGQELDDGEYQATCDDYGDIFITKSPYYTHAKYCSPCAPGACYLRDYIPDDIQAPKAYCFGPDFFEDGKAPYSIYKVESGECIYVNVQ